VEVTIMQRTLIAVFDNRGDAQSAIEELVLSGFSRQQIRLSEGDPTGASSAITGAPGTESTTGAGAIVDSIRNFLGNLFGTDNSEHVQKYSDAVTRGHHVLTLTAADEPEVERAADIVERYGPVDIDEKAAEWSGASLAGDAMRRGGSGPQRSASLSQQSAQGGQGAAQGGAPGTAQGGAQAGSQQRAATLDDDRAVPVTTPRPGVKVFEHHLAEPALGSFAEIAVADEMYFRSHYNSNYAGAGEHFEDYMPAYQYGWGMASEEHYRGRLWKDVEPALRSDWEGRNPGSAWSKFKAAIHHGWQRITS
jgi:hypothetical protein